MVLSRLCPPPCPTSLPAKGGPSTWSSRVPPLPGTSLGRVWTLLAPSLPASAQSSVSVDRAEPDELTTSFLASSAHVPPRPYLSGLLLQTPSALDRDSSFHASLSHPGPRPSILPHKRLRNPHFPHCRPHPHGLPDAPSALTQASLTGPHTDPSPAPLMRGQHQPAAQARRAGFTQPA